jgi:hypothetical protein
MKKTTSIFQTFDLTGFQKAGEELIVRPPQQLRAFRVTIFVSSVLNTAKAAAAYISNYDSFNELTAIYLSNFTFADTTTAVPPGNDITVGLYQLDRIVLDRRGVGYMADTFYVRDASGASGSSLISFIWEGEID